ncbi:Mov34/MPN/PAD-1 family protein [Paenibacillus sp. SC116]|uniref:Mov34/MPN/PAD-1 family protein n=1 Tax=Paenibacillus sp. SC116 TaxID=2968986 RepID=UPI00215B0D52|nr:Mov34/MPN/PAD-1 family protein [Paenibacillus sp. SC116]MCR8843386.1 Mov34/MPN/PAD-1 family protein [Paenibacillus sp. SC116]
MTSTQNVQSKPINIQTISIMPSAVQSMLEHLRINYPHEGCGILLRDKYSSSHAFHIFEPIPNTDQHPQHSFHLEPSVYIPLLFRYSEAQWERILVHSHPHTSATISLEDKLGWMDTKALWTGWLIVSFQSGIVKPSFSYYTHF